MDKLEKLKQLYFFSVLEMLENPLRWKEFLPYAGNMYKYDFAMLVIAFEQNKSFHNSPPIMTGKQSAGK